MAAEVSVEVGGIVKMQPGSNKGYARERYFTRNVLDDLSMEMLLS